MRGIVGLIFLFVVLFVFQAEAGLGPTVPLHETPTGLCLLDFSDPDSHAFENVCSGILVDTGHILTAAHCVQKTLPKTIYCGQDLKEVGFKLEAAIHPAYAKNVVAQDGMGLEVYDLAMIELSSLTAVEPVEFLGRLPATADTCGFFGFSRFRQQAKNEVRGVDRGWFLESKNLSYSDRQLGLLRLDGMKVPGGLLQLGDSGGPMMCWHKGAWKLVGVNSSRNFPATSNFALVERLSAFRSGNQVIAVSEVVHQATKRDSYGFQLAELKTKLKALELRENPFVEEFEKLENLYADGLSIEEIQPKLRALKQNIRLALLKQPGLLLRLKSFAVIQPSSAEPSRSLGDMEYNFFEVESFDLQSGTAKGRLRTLGYSNYFMCGGELFCDQQDLKSVQIRIEDLEIFASVPGH